jgi:hypothetical protein
MDNKDERIQLNTLNGKNRPFMLRKKYDSLRDFILEALQRQQQISLMELMEQANNKFDKVFFGEVALSLLDTKKDLEVRGLIKIAHERDRTQLISLKRHGKKINISGSHFSANHDFAIVGDQLERLKKW